VTLFVPGISQMKEATSGPLHRLAVHRNLSEGEVEAHNISPLGGISFQKSSFIGDRTSSFLPNEKEKYSVPRNRAFTK
jgi:hypothetical protein